MRAPTLAMLVLAPAICFGAPDLDTLLQRLARPAPATTPFVDVRFSKLLDEPLVTKGQLEYLEDGTLVRAVAIPFQERTEIRGETVNVQRVGKPARRFSLKRAPELRSMLGGFTAVLGGGRVPLAKDFDLAVTGEPEQWELQLTPKSPQMARHVRDIVIHGTLGDPRCIVVTQPNESASIMLVGNAAESGLPAPLTRDWLDGFCRSKG